MDSDKCSERDVEKTLDVFKEVIQEMNTVPFDANLADYMEEDQLQNISNDLLGGIEEDKSSRKGWEEAYEKGIKNLKF